MLSGIRELEHETDHLLQDHRGQGNAMVLGFLCEL